MLSSSILIDYVGVKLVIETFRFKDGDVYDYEILLKVFLRILKIWLHGKLHFTIFHEKS